MECHPLLSQKELLAFCGLHGIRLQAWSPLIRGKLDDKVLLELAAKYGKTPAQIVLRWDIQNQIVVIPKSVHKERIIENSQIFDFQLSAEDMQRIDGLNKNKRLGPDPDRVNF